jgi:L-ascorbate metabolism protein UlaG (beta-lactamase superfamily)
MAEECEHPRFGLICSRFPGTAAFEITTAGGKRLLIDPYLESNPVSPVPVVLGPGEELVL